MLDFLLGNTYNSDPDEDLSIKKDILDAFSENVGKSSLWIALAMAIIFITVGIIINFKYREKFRTFITVAVSTIIGFAIALSFVLLYVTFTRMSINGDFTSNFWMLVGFAGTVIVAITTCALLKIFYNKGFKYSVWASIAVIIAYAIALLCLLPTDESTTPTNYALYIILASVLVIAIALIAILGDLRKGNTDSTKSLTYAGICIAIAYGLSYIKFIDLPAGGSITLVSMLPIMLYSYMFGTKKGVITGLVYGVLQLMQDPQIYEPLQVLLDYPIAFAALGVAGVFKDRKFLKGNKILEFVLGIVLAGFMRYTAHVLSGYFVFYSWASWSDFEALQNSPILYSIAYNTAIFVDAVIDAIVGAILFSSKSLMTFINAVNPKPVLTLDQELNEEEINKAE